MMTMSLYMLAFSYCESTSLGPLAEQLECSPKAWETGVQSWVESEMLNTQHYKVWMKGKVEQPRERSCTLP